MRRQRKTYSKQTGFIWVCIALVISAVGGVVTKSASVFEVVMLDLIVVIPILIKRYKYDIDLGSMLVEGLLRAAIWAAIFLGAAFLSKNSAVCILAYKITGYGYSFPMSCLTPCGTTCRVN